MGGCTSSSHLCSSDNLRGCSSDLCSTNNKHCGCPCDIRGGPCDIRCPCHLRWCTHDSLRLRSDRMCISAWEAQRERPPFVNGGMLFFRCFDTILFSPFGCHCS